MKKTFYYLVVPIFLLCSLSAQAQKRPPLQEPPPVADVGPPKSQRECKGAEIHPDSQYIVDVKAGTVIDKVTGLMWTRCALGLAGKYCEQYSDDNPLRYSQNDAKRKWPHSKVLLLMTADAEQDLINNPLFAGLKGWRIPTVKEFETLREKNCSFPAMNERVFPTGEYGVAQGITTFHTSDKVRDGYRVYHFDFAYGSAVDRVPQAARLYPTNESDGVRLVRNNR